MHSLLARLLVVITIALVPALAFQAYTAADARRVRQQLMEDEALRLVHMVSFEQQRIVEGAEQVLDVIGGSPAVQDNIPDLCRRLLGNLVTGNPRYLAAIIIGLDGIVKCAANPADVGRNLSDRAYFQEALHKNTAAVSEYTIGRGTRQKIIAIGKAFRNPSGEIVGVVEVSLSLQWLGEQLAKLSFPADTTARIADRNGIILARFPDSQRYVGVPSLALNHFTLEGNKIAVAAGTRITDGHRIIIAYAPPGAVPSGLAVAVGLDPDSAFAAVTQANRLGRCLIIAGGGLALLLTALVGNRLIRRPVNQLLTAAANWRTGALAVRARLHNDSSEFSRLGAALNQMAEALEAREHSLRAALESTTDHVMVIDADWRFTYVNKRAKIHIGRDEIIGLSIWDVFPHLIGTEFGDSCRTVMEQRRPVKFEMRSARRDRYFEIHAYPSDTGITLYARDVTEQRLAAIALQESETRFQLAQEAAGFGLWDRNLVAGTMIWSAQNWRLFGQAPRNDAPDEAIVQTWIHPDDRPRFLAEMQDSVRNPECPVHTEYRVIWPDNSIHWLFARAVVVCGDDGKPGRMVGLTMDVTPSRETEAALRQLGRDLKQRIQEEVAACEIALARAAHAERMQALGQLAGGIAHDFNNVLQAISGAVGLIARRAEGNVAIRRLTKIADEAAQRGSSVTRRLLAFGRRGDLETEACDIADLLHELSEILRHTLGAGVAVQIEAGSDLPPISADRRQLETVIVNLATNARDAMPGGGRLILSAALATVPMVALPHPAALLPGTYIRLAVSDSGTGMDAETLARAREPFFTTKQVGIGTGLGLAMAQQFVEQCGGRMSIESRPGEGTTVILWLSPTDAVVAPANPASPPDRPMAPNRPLASDRSIKSARIVLVDDEASIRETVSQYLQEAGYQVTAAANGTEALALLEQDPAIDALVTDLSMPGMDGIAVIRAMHSRDPAVPAILLTGFLSDDAERALATSVAGSVSLLRKPVADRQLLDRLDAMLVSRRTGHGQFRPDRSGVQHPMGAVDAHAGD